MLEQFTFVMRVEREDCFGRSFVSGNQKPNPFGKLRAGSVAKRATRVGHPEASRRTSIAFQNSVHIEFTFAIWRK
jgi:hypothetical protein